MGIGEGSSRLRVQYAKVVTSFEQQAREVKIGVKNFGLNSTVGVSTNRANNRTPHLNSISLAGALLGAGITKMHKKLPLSLRQL